MYFIKFKKAKNKKNKKQKTKKKVFNHVRNYNIKL